MIRKSLLVFLAILPWFADAQTFNCYPIDDCDELRLLIIRETPPQGSCPTVGYGDCSQADAFHQVVYRVYLRYAAPDNTPSGDLNFNLDYKALNARIRLNNAAGNSGYSYIDNMATRSCYVASDVGSLWSQGGNVIFDLATKNEVAIDFENTSQSACASAGSLITFAPSTPNGAPACPTGKVCTYAELFPIIVQAYPGELINLTCSTLLYTDFTGTRSCNPSVCAVNTGSGLSAYTVPTPSAPGGENLLLDLKFGTPVLNNDGIYEVDVNLEKVGGTFGNSIVSYHEFMVKLSSDVAMPTPTSNNPNHTVEVRKVIKTNGATEYYMHHVVHTDYNLGPDGSASVVKLFIGPPMPANQMWTARLEFVETSRSRIRTAGECSTLDQQTPGIVLSNPNGEDPCDGLTLPKATFRIEAVGGLTDCEPPSVRMGLEITGSPYNITFDYFECQVAFHTTPGLTVSNVVFPDGMDCNNSNPCFPTICWSTAPGFPNVVNIRLCDDNGALNFNEETFFIVEFAGEGCISSGDIEILRFQRDINGPSCVPEIDLDDQGFPVCTPQLQGVIASHFAPDQGIENVEILLEESDASTGCQQSSGCMQFTSETLFDGAFSFCPCSICTTYILTPQSDDSDYLNGVSTFDLVKINQHILGIELFSTPYRIIAADANGSKSVTTFDIAELRKLILGIYTVLPNSPSWRYVPQNYTFPNPDLPWSPQFPQTIEYQDVNGYDFFAIKIGDVNDNVILSNSDRLESTAPVKFAWTETPRNKNQMITVPILYEGSESIEAYQFGLKFDPMVLEFMGASQGELQGVDSGAFGLERVKNGEIRTLWFVPDYSDPEPYLKPGTVLFNLTFKVLEDLPESGIPLTFDDDVLSSLAWSPDSKAYKITKSERTSERALAGGIPLSKIVCSPNPTSGAIKFTLSNQVKQTARLVVMDAFGSVLWMKSINLDANEQTFDVDVLTQKPAGVYLWKLWSPDGEMQTGHIVKQ